MHAPDSTASPQSLPTLRRPPVFSKHINMRQVPLADCQPLAAWCAAVVLLDSTADSQKELDLIKCHTRHKSNLPLFSYPYKYSSKVSH